MIDYALRRRKTKISSESHFHLLLGSLEFLAIGCGARRGPWRVTIAAYRGSRCPASSHARSSSSSSRATILPTRVLAKEERLIGWLGEVARPLHGSGAPGGDKPTGEAAELAHLGYWLEPVSWYPRAFHLHNFMSPQEADRILEIARPRCVYFNSRSTYRQSV